MPEQYTFPDEIFDIIQEIANLSSEGNYLFRGEPKHHCKISSTLYRECERVVREARLEDELSDFDIKAIESEISNQVKVFVPRGEHASDLSIFTELQHYGSQTNLIDFTTDFHIALFFACDGQPDENGRVILQQRHLVKIERPLGVGHRVLAQKSVFVRPERGYIDPSESSYKVVTIPACLKEDILRYLRNTHGITTETIYNDIHGYIRNRDIHRAAYSEFYIAVAYESEAEKMEDPEEKHKLWDKAIEHYSKAIDYNPHISSVYAKRSTLYRKKEEYDNSIQDRLRAWEDSPDVVLDPDTYRESTGEWMVDPVSALKFILEDYDYLEYDERNSEDIVKLRVKVKETFLETERDSVVMHHIKNQLEQATGRFYVPILNPVSGSPSQEILDKRWTYFTLHEGDRPRRMENT